MGFLSDLIERGKSLLAPPPDPTERLAIESNSFDRADWVDVQNSSPVVRKQVADLSRDVDFAGELLTDLYCGLFKQAPHLRKADEMAATHQVNHQVISELLKAPEVKTLRQHTVGDKFSSAMGMQAVEEEVVKTMVRVREARTEAQNAADAAAAERERAAGELAQWLQAAAEQQANPNSPLSEEGIQAGLSSAMDQFNQAQQKIEMAEQEAQQAGQRAAQAGTQAIRSAAKAATEELDQEEALMNAFGVDPGAVEKMSVRERLELAAKLKDNRLAKFIKLLGQFKQVQQAESRKRVVNASSEVHGVRYSNDMPHMVAGEYLNFADPSLQTLMLVRLVNSELLTTDVRGKEKLGQGPIICVVDESGSMAAEDVAGGSREAWSKALSLAMLDQARHRKRDFVYIGFGSEHEQHMVEFPGGQADLAKIIQMTEHFFAGGTHYEKPMQMALDYITKAYDLKELQRPDIVFISDDAYGHMPAAFLERFKKAKEKIGIKAYGIALGCSTSGAMEELCDNVREVTELVSDPRTVGDLFRTI